MFSPVQSQQTRSVSAHLLLFSSLPLLEQCLQRSGCGFLLPQVQADQRVDRLKSLNQRKSPPDYPRDCDRDDGGCDGVGGSHGRGDDGAGDDVGDDGGGDGDDNDCLLSLFS